MSAESSLVEEMDADLEQFLKQKIEESKNIPRPFNFDNKSVDEIAEEMKQHPVFMTEFDASRPMNPAVEALQALKYDSNDNDENALSYKEDGNKNFGRNKYRWAIDNYTAGLSCHPTDHTLVSTLLANRAAAHFHIGNFRSSINDCVEALRYNPSHKKAWIRVIDSNQRLHKSAEVLQWCEKALSKFPDEDKIIESRRKALLNIRRRERDERKLQLEMKKQRGQKMLVVHAIKKRNIQFQSVKVKSGDDNDPGGGDNDPGGGDNGDDDGDNDDDDGGLLKMVCQEHNGAKVELVDGIELQWPVMFLYPEHQQSDFILAFHELSTFSEHLGPMFATSPPWDVQQQYTPLHLNIYHEERFSNGTSTFHLIPPQSSLFEVLSQKTFTLTSSLLIFFIFVENSAAEEIFLNENK